MNRLLFILTIVWIFLSCKKELDPQEIPIEELTISQIHQAYQNGDFSSETLVKAYLSRITLLDSSLNSISVVNPEALAIAKSLDEEFEKTGKLRPLHGIPLIVKDNINT